MPTIITIDGGGIKGIIPAMILAAIEKAMDRKIHEIAELQCGTSIGGIITLWTALGKPAIGAVDLLSNEGSQIFQRSWKSYFGFHRPKYSPLALERVLASHFGGCVLSHCKTKTMVTSQRLTDYSSKMFKSWRDGDLPVTFAARATSAAPTYFSPADGGYVDGGTWANNPSTEALAEGVRLWGNLSDITLLSIGCGMRSPDVNPYMAMRWGIWGYLPHLTGMMIDGGVEGADYCTGQFLAHDRYLRIQPALGYVSPEMDDASPAHVRDLKDVAHRVIDERLDDIVKFLRGV